MRASMLKINVVALAMVVAGCGAGRTTFASYPSGAAAFDRATSDPKAVEIADKVITAAGGHDKWTGVKQIRWTQSITQGEGKPAVMFDEAWDRWNGRHHLQIHQKSGDLIVMRGIYEDRGV